MAEIVATKANGKIRVERVERYAKEMDEADLPRHLMELTQRLSSLRIQMAKMTEDEKDLLTEIEQVQSLIVTKPVK